ncbi:MAG: hypothetical protein KH319_06125 [Butyricicoccus pullicaecorum]|nr:hypothetical protein [Butyricicoccus pullicaecorum]
MDKQIYIINGVGGAGKDTVCELAAERYRVQNVSSITPIVEIAKFAGWDGVKTPASRRLLARLKEVFTEYNDLSFSYCMEQLAAFRAGNAQILFVHIREPEEIERFRKAAGENCRTLLVRRPSLEARGQLGNRADDSVEEYQYDEILVNDGTVEQLREKTFALLERKLKCTKADNMVE